MRLVVADTNVLVSAIQFGGKPKQLLDLAANGHIDLAVSNTILEETLRVLRDKFHYTPDGLRETDNQLRVIARTVMATESIKAVDADPSDNRILECAVAADAEVILSGDKHLRALGSFRAMPIHRLRRFAQEARAAAALSHPNILAVYDLGTHDGATYIVSELLEGTTLREALANGGFPVRKAIDYATQIANGLATAHERGIIHRDLKPENLFITSDGRAKILDFGLAKLIETVPADAGAMTTATLTAGTTPGIVLGTIGYMSPEQVRARVVDHRTDIFSFGATLYES